MECRVERADMMKPYDAKKSFWVPDEDGAFVEGLLQSDDGKKATVMIGHDVSLVRYNGDWMIHRFFAASRKRPSRATRSPR